MATHENEIREKERKQQPESPGSTLRAYNPVDEEELTIEEMRERLVQAHDFSNRVRSLGDIALQIDAARSQVEVLQVLRNQIQYLIDYSVCFVSLMNSSRTHYVIHTLSSLADATDLNHKHFHRDQGTPGWVMVHQSPVVTEMSASPSFAEDLEGILRDLGMKSLLVVPLRTADETIGSLGLSSLRPGAFDSQDLLIAQLLAMQVAVVLKDSALFEDAKKRIAQIELVNEIAGKLTSTLEMDELLNSAAETIRKAFSYFDVTIFMARKAEQDLLLVAHSGSYVNFLPHGYRQKMSDGLVGWVAAHGERVLANDVTEEPRYVAYEYHNTRSELTLPIKVGEEVVGVLNVEDTKLHAFDEMDVMVLETLCDQLGSAIGNAQMYDQVKKANATLTELDKMKSDFLGIVSHDFRSPLASIVLAAKALLKRGLSLEPRRINEYLSIIIDQANKLGQLAEDTLSITKIESGQLSYFFKVVNVERLVKDAAALVQLSRRHSIEVHVEGNVSYIKGDQTKLRQVVQNLISNAVKYSPKGGLVKVTAESYPGDQILLSVSDEGIGIPGEQMGRLFQKFSRIDTPEAREIKGSGLGLWICKEVVRAHGGRIWAESEVGKGTTFKFTIRKAAQ